MNPESNPYIPAAGSRPPVLAGREEELDTFTVALGRLGKGVHARSMILDGVRGVGKTVLLREFNYIAREHGWITSGAVECDEGEQLPRIVAKLCHRALRDLDKRWTAGEAMRRAFGVLKAFTLTLGEDGHWRFNIDFDAVKGVADSGDPEVDIVELLGEVGRAASEHGEGVLLLLDEMQFLSRASKKKKRDELYASACSRSARSTASRAGSKALTVPASRENVSYAPDALGYILEQSQGYPDFLQQWGEAVWNEAETSPIGMQDALTAHELVTDELDRRFFRDRYDTATEAERIYMAAMADLGPGSHSSSDIAARMGLTVKTASVRRDGLLKKGLIYSRVDTQLDFTVPQFATFIERIHLFDAAQRPGADDHPASAATSSTARPLGHAATRTSPPGTPARRSREPTMDSGLRRVSI